MSVIFLTEGSTEIGTGHITRCEAISQALDNYWEKSCFFVDADKDFFSSALPGETLYFNWKSDWKRLKKEIERLKCLIEIQAVFVDSYQITEAFLRNLNTLDIKIFMLDDQGQYDYAYGTIFNPTVNATKNIYKLHNHSNLYTGASYCPLRDAFWYIHPRPYLQRKGVFVTLGGGANTAALEKITTALEDYGEEVIVLAANTQLKAKGSIKPINHCLDAVQMKTYIENSRAIVCAGGGTLLEAACCGTPSVVVKVADNQELNIQAWSELGFCHYAGTADDNELGRKVLNELKKLEDHIIWRKASQAGASLVDGLGAKRIAHIVCDAMENSDKRYLLKESFEVNNLTLKNYLSCTHSEHLDILSARNDEKVVRGCISQRGISIEQHQAFILSLAASNTSVYWRVYKNNIALGTISLTDISFRESSAMLGYYKDPACNRTHVGQELVKAAVDITFNILGLKRLTGETLENNIASKKSMEAAGLAFAGTIEKIVGNKNEILHIYEINSDN